LTPVRQFHFGALWRAVVDLILAQPESPEFHSDSTALATGMHPERSGVMANFQYRPDLNWLSPYGTEALDAVRRGDLATDGKYLDVPTVAEMVHADSWTTRALTRGLWRKGVPKYSLLWLSEPDGAQHAYAPGSENALTALESSDKNLAAVVKALEEKDVLSKTDIFVVSDHGFSTVARGVEVIEALKRAKFVAGKQFENPEPGDIMVVNLGGSLSFYVFDHHEPTVRRLVQYLQGSDYAGVIFSSLKVDGTFEMAQAHVNISKGAPDVLVSLRWSEEKSDLGVPGTILAMDGKRGTGVHASLSRFDLHNTLVASGPDFKAGCSSAAISRSELRRLVR
jgi:hypothetical protein